jgi:hypothetical protein
MTGIIFGFFAVILLVLISVLLFFLSIIVPLFLYRILYDIFSGRL